MLKELSIKNFAIIDELSMSFGSGFSVLTGETGAGKSIIIDALGLLLGGRADSVLIRDGCDTALVEGSFMLADTLGKELQLFLEREGLENEAHEVTLTLGRELRSSGRNICRVNGRMVNLAVLRAIGVRLVDVHGQSEHLSLLRVSEHIELLDSFGGLSSHRTKLGSAVRELNAVRASLSSMRAGERDVAQRADLLSFQINEIMAAGLHPGEEDELREERARLANAEKLLELTQVALQASGDGHADDGFPAAGDSLEHLAQALERLARIDVGLETQYALAQSLLVQLRDLTGHLINYRDGIEFNPRRLNEVEDRLVLIQDLYRKYGSDISEVVDKCRLAQVELESISGSGERIKELDMRERELLDKLSDGGTALSVKRREAGDLLSKQVMSSLSELNMDGARFKVSIEWHDDPDGVPVDKGRRVRCDVNGLDRVEFMVAPNPGEGLKPIAKIASGGETSRLMLAIREVLARADCKPTLIFDEIDQGIGGRIGAIVGRKLWSLTTSHQVLCITHLPQLACYGDEHFKLEKQVNRGRTFTQVVALEHEERVEELSQMVGAQSDAVRQSAAGLLDSAKSHKQAR